MVSFSSVRGGHSRFLVVVGMVVVVGAALQPWLWGLVRTLAVRLHSDSSQAEQTSDLRARIGRIQETLAQQQLYLGPLSEVVPREQGTVQMIEALEGLAQEHQLALHVRSISEPGGPVVSPAPAAAVLDSVVISLIAAGPSDRLLAFVNGIERLPELVQVAELELRLPQPADPVAVTADGTSFVLRLEVRFFIQSADTGGYGA